MRRMLQRKARKARLTQEVRMGLLPEVCGFVDRRDEAGKEIRMSGPDQTTTENIEQNPLHEVYSKFRVYYYRDVFKRIQSRELSLTTTEAYCIEVIGALGTPTINEFADFIGISAPNATYKVNSLIRKGYLQKVQSGTDKREFHLQVTEKYYKYWNINKKYMDIVEGRLKQRLSKEEFELFNRIMRMVSTEMMPEVPILSAGESER